MAILDLNCPSSSSSIIPSIIPFLIISFLLNVLRKSLTKFCVYIYIDKTYVDIITHHFSHICNGVMALDLCLNFVHSCISSQYHENKFIELYQFLYLILTRSTLKSLFVIYRKFVSDLWPFINVKILFPLNIFRTNIHNYIKLYMY